MMSVSEPGVRKKTCNGGLIQRVRCSFSLINNVAAATVWLYLIISNNILPIHQFSHFKRLNHFIYTYIYIYIYKFFNKDLNISEIYLMSDGQFVANA